MSAPYELEAFDHPVHGKGVFAAGYTGGAVAVGPEGVLWRYSDGSQIAGAIFADVTGDGLDDTLLAEYPSSLVVIDGATGVEVAKRSFSTVPEGLAAGDANGDGTTDIYAVTQGNGLGVTNTVSLLDGRTLAPEWSVDLGVDQRFVLAADAGDLNGDGRDDLLFGTYSNGPKVYAYASDGTKLWEANLGGVVSNVVIADGGESVFATRTGAQLTSLDPKTGAVRWTVTGNGGFSKLASDDLDGDGSDDAVWALYGATGKSASWQVMAVDGASGTPQWTVPTLSPPKGLTIGDIDGDGAPDVAATTQDISSNVREAENFVWAIDGGTGRPLWTHVLSGDATTYLSDVTLADVAGTNRREVVAAPYFDRLLGLSATDGARVWSADIGSTSLDAIAVDLDGDGAEEVVEGSADFRLTARDGATGAVRWSRELGNQVWALSHVASGTTRDVIAASSSVLNRVRGSDGAVVWSRPLEGMVTRTMVIERSGQSALIAVGAQLKRVDRGPGHSSIAGSLTILDASTGLPKWHLRVAGTPWNFVLHDVNGDGARDLVTGSPTAQQALTVYDGARLDTAPVPLWHTQGDAGVSGMTVSGGRVLSVRSATRRVVAQNGGTGAEAWSYTHPVAIRSLGFDDLTGDGVDDALLGTEIFAERLVGVDGATGQKLFDVPAGVRFLKAASVADVSGDGVSDLIYASDGGTFGEGGVFAIDGKHLSDAPVRLWAHERINAWGLSPLELSDGTSWLAFGVTTLPDAVAVLRPHPD
jgi:outer membrane protein assembly factor BamB